MMISFWMPRSRAFCSTCSAAKVEPHEPMGLHARAGQAVAAFLAYLPPTLSDPATAT